MSIILAVFPIGDAALHGFSEPSFRWTFLLTLFNIITACYLFDHLEIINIKKIYPIASLVAAFCIVIVPLSAIIEGKFDIVFNEYGRNYFVFWVCYINFCFCVFAKAQSN